MNTAQALYCGFARGWVADFQCSQEGRNGFGMPRRSGSLPLGCRGAVTFVMNQHRGGAVTYDFAGIAQ
jgi:hypothetical protein